MFELGLGSPPCRASSTGMPPLTEVTETERVLALLRVFDGAPREGAGHTTNIVAVDRAGRVRADHEPGLGSGDFLPAFDLHLNSMLGEADLVRGGARPARGWRA